MHKNITNFFFKNAKNILIHRLSFSRDDHKDAAPSPEAEQDTISQVSSTKSFVTQEHFIVEEHPKSQLLEKKVEEEEENKNKDEKKAESEGWGVFKADGIELQLNLKQQVEKEREKDDAGKEDDDGPEQYFIGESTSKLLYTYLCSIIHFLNWKCVCFFKVATNSVCIIYSTLYSRSLCNGLTGTAQISVKSLSIALYISTYIYMRSHSFYWDSEHS